jgi:hypothetical protein
VSKGGKVYERVSEESARLTTVQWPVSACMGLASRGRRVRECDVCILQCSAVHRVVRIDMSETWMVRACVLIICPLLCCAQYASAAC